MNTIRINKYLADHGYASRRESDVLIKKGLVFINGKRATLGDQVTKGDTVELRGTSEEKKVYYAFYKPAGLTTVNATPGEKDIVQSVQFPEAVYPVGRLDKDSEGLIIMTNDGRVAKKLLQPEQETEKEYSVTVDKDITHDFLKRLQAGVDIGAVGEKKRYVTKPALVRRTSKKTFDIVLTEGKNRQIRRMCAAFGYTVVRLARFRIGNLTLGTLKPGSFTKLDEEELNKLF